MQKQIGATLRLENGIEFRGYSFGHNEPVSGEIVFSTAMIGYPEHLTDPTYTGQILCFTYPMIGNYGMPSEELSPEGISLHLESAGAAPKGVIAFDWSETYSNWEAEKALEPWMKEQKLTGIYGIDTRELVKILRENGSMKGIIIPDGADEQKVAETALELITRRNEEPVAEVSCREIIRYSAKTAEQKAAEIKANEKKSHTGDEVYPKTRTAGKTVVLVDLGVKHSILRDLTDRGVNIIRVPYNCDFIAEGLEFDGVFVSNGPGCPCALKETLDILRKAMDSGKPVLGIGLGYLALAKAAGAEIKALDHAHRGSNQPVRKEGSNRSYITAQNSGYTVADAPEGWNVLFRNLNDGAIDGLRHAGKTLVAGTQFDTSCCTGINDTFTLIDEFISKL